MVRTVAIIGAGQLGSRHLQSLKSIKTKIKLEVIEPSEEMRKVAFERYAEMPETDYVDSFNFCDNIKSLSEKLDLVIIATNADVRAKILQELIELKEIKNLVLEKVLFQTVDDLDYFKEQFAQKNIQVWVNHPRRMFKFYDNFKNYFINSKALSYHVQGASWGLACNGLHYLDHILYLTGENEPEVTILNSAINQKVEPAKRIGNYEIFGSLVGKLGKASFCLSSEQEIELESPVTISILADDLRLLVDEAQGKAMYALRANGWKWENVDEKILFYQSELTSDIVDSIFNVGTCNLPTYQEAVLLHKPFLGVVKEVIESSLGENLDICPIS